MGPVELGLEERVVLQVEARLCSVERDRKAQLGSRKQCDKWQCTGPQQAPDIPEKPLEQLLPNPKGCQEPVHVAEFRGKKWNKACCGRKGGKNAEAQRG